MRKVNDTIIIAIDHGFGNIKTANHVFRTGVLTYDSEPLFTKNLLVYDGRFFLIGEGHKAFTPDKVTDGDYYVLTLAAIAEELQNENITEANVYLSAGLPLNWVSQQKEKFKAYLLQNEEVRFSYKKKDYHIRFAGADVYPQGFAAIAEQVSSFKGVSLLADIGNGTMNLLYLRDGKPDSCGMYTEKFGTQQCINAIKDAMMDSYQTRIDESIIETILRDGTANIDREYLKLIRKTAEQYVAQIFQKLRDHDFDPKLMQLYVVGGGGCLIRNFGSYDKKRVTINNDICATAKGYEYLAEYYLKKREGIV